MVVVPISKLKSGEVLEQDVITQMGSVLLQKGKKITSREIDILKAFLIHDIPIQSQQLGSNPASLGNAAEGNEATEVTAVSRPFQEEYDKMLNFLKKVFNAANAGSHLPILDLRSQLEILLNKIDEYHILSFTPKANIEDYIYHNSILVGLTSYKLGKWYGLQQKDLIPVALAGLLHDIGNVKMDKGMLYKPSKLTKEEFDDIKRHTVVGYNILKNVTGINEGVKLAALQHHEKEDGSGYPFGVKGDKIHPYAKIIAVADVFHAMTNQRYHKKAISPYLVLEQISQESFGKLEPVLVRNFINKVTQFSSGMLVRLSDNRIGEVVFSDRDHPTRPLVKVNGTIVNLAQERNIYIEETLQK